MKYNSQHSRKPNYSSANKFDSVRADGCFGPRNGLNSVLLNKSLNSQQDFHKLSRRNHRKQLATGTSLPHMQNLIEGGDKEPKPVESNYQMYRNKFQE